MIHMHEYDKTDPYSIEKYAQRLVGRTFANVCEADAESDLSIINDDDAYNASVENKKQNPARSSAGRHGLRAARSCAGGTAGSLPASARGG